MFLSQVGTRKNANNESKDNIFIISLFFFSGKFGLSTGRSAILLLCFPSVFFIALFYNVITCNSLRIFLT